MALIASWLAWITGSTVFSKAKAWVLANLLEIVKWLAIVGAALAILARVRNAGRTVEKVEQLQQAVKVQQVQTEQRQKVEKVVKDVENNVRRLPAGDAANRLRKGWNRNANGTFAAK